MIIFLLFSIAPYVFSHEPDETSDGSRKVRLVGGAYALDGQFPYHASVMVDGEFRCGAALIGKSHALSAAHCFNLNNDTFDARDINILIGHTSIEQQWFAKIVMGVVNIYVPKIYSQLSEHFYVTGDIAVLKLGDKLDVPDDWILGLPSNKSYFGEFGVVTGHGYNWKFVLNPRDPKSPQNGGKDGYLRYLNLQILQNQDCSEAFDNNGKVLPDSFVCAKAIPPYIPGSLCNGDSGGPLVADDYSIVGIVSVGSKTCEPGIPEIFTRVSSYIYFVDKSIKDLDDPDIIKYDFTYYTYQFD